jgi:hypothetical protein
VHNQDRLTITPHTHPLQIHTSYTVCKVDHDSNSRHGAPASVPAITPANQKVMASSKHHDMISSHRQFLPICPDKIGRNGRFNTTTSSHLTNSSDALDMDKLLAELDAPNRAVIQNNPVFFTQSLLLHNYGL